MPITRTPARLVLQDGTIFRGTSFGATGSTDGEVVFNTSMTGYQETLTDPSYYGQIVTMTYPLIGNYGVNEADVESGRIQVRGFVVRECSQVYSNFRATSSLHEYLASQGVVGVEGVDTRSITRRLRIAGAMPGFITTEDVTDTDLQARAATLPGMAGQDLVPWVTCSKPHGWDKSFASQFGPKDAPCKGRFDVVAIDYGAKANILRWLVQCGCRVTVVPSGTSAQEVLGLRPDGVFLANGPGDPRAVQQAIECIRGLMGERPIFGICLGHQLISLAAGGDIYKLKFGHRGANQPVKDLRTGKISITSQNHGFATDAGSLKGTGLEVTEINLNDGTVEGVQHKELPIFAVQYHPEASPGPHDATHLFQKFTQMLSTGKPPACE